MDLLTQGLVGSAVAQSFCEPKAQNRAALCGAIAGLAPDLDALISSSADPAGWFGYDPCVRWAATEKIALFFVALFGAYFVRENLVRD